MPKIERLSKITYNKSGSGSVSARIILPSFMLDLMNINIDNREVIIIYEDDKIIIKKPSH